MSDEKTRSHEEWKTAQIEKFRVENVELRAEIERLRGDLQSVSNELTTIIGKPEKQRLEESKASFIIRRITQAVMKIEDAALEKAAAVVDTCNATGPYEAIGAASKIRTLKGGKQ